MLHAKMIDVDGQNILAGSANYSVRALSEYAGLNFRLTGIAPCATVIDQSFEHRRQQGTKALNARILTYSWIEAGSALAFA